ncbi:hypothetical protein T07_14054 [Trichinella nelsoni]|uniref:Uncharacterized protein n=1 Tax=Trichinella nelsoni TaxID=6336 RepID=A0A0V0RNK5_9BILA|nr:hypothetical protein T07_14054 [Trichinella nelsoni]
MWIGWIESFVGQLRSLVNSVRWSSEHDYKGKLSMEINFKCIMPKLMKGATPNELIKGVTANLMSIIGQVSEPARQ